MAQIDVSINGRNYQIACDDGQEEHLGHLAQYVDKRVQELVTSLGQVGDSRLLVMASLMVADELSEAYASLERSRGSNGNGVDDGLAEFIEEAAEKIENVAASLERA